MAMVKKPSVFISSTVYDLQDLRSALKFWLEELGYEVMLSEYNDFPKEADKNSYEACLAAIAQADYFVLIIGNRVGGWFDEAEKISITRMEYRAAREHFEKNGTPKPIVFVRQNLWDVREDRAALGHYLKDVDEKQLSDAEKKQIAKHPSKFVDNADAIFSFLKEVGQVDAMKEATANGAALPAGNWIHRFSTFREVVDALRVALNAKSHIELHVLISNLVSEMTANLSQLLNKSKHSEIMPIADCGMFAAKSMKGGVDDQSDMKGRYATWLIMFKVMTIPVPRRLSTLFIRQAVLSGAFMSHEPGSGTFEPTVLHTSLLELMTLIEGLQSSPPLDPKSVLDFSKTMKQYADAKDQKVSIPNIDIALICSEAKTFDRITDLSRRCLRNLLGDGNAFDGVGQWSPSVFPDESEKITSETVTQEEAKQWATTK